MKANATDLPPVTAGGCWDRHAPTAASPAPGEMRSMGDTTIGLLHPGEMGAAVGQCLAGAGHRVLWAAGGTQRGDAVRAPRRPG